MHAHDFVAGALVGSTASSVVFVVTAVLQRSGRSSRILTSSQFIVTATLLLYASWTQLDRDGARLIELVAMTGLLAAVATAWSGIRSFHGKPPRLLAILLAAGLVMAAAGADTTMDVGIAPATLIAGLLAAGFAAHSLYEFQLGSWSQHPYGRVLQVFLGLLVLAGLALALTSWQNDHPVMWSVLGVTALQICMAMCFVVLLREKVRSWGHTAAEASNPLADLDVLAPASFRFAAQGRLGRLGLVGGHACMILVSVEDLAALNSAFGRAAGDQAVRKLGETIRTQLPPWAPIGHLGAGNFATLAPAASPQTAHEIVTNIEEALLTSRNTTVAGIRIGAVYGIADTFSSSGDYAALLERAIASMTDSISELTSGSS